MMITLTRQLRNLAVPAIILAQPLLLSAQVSLYEFSETVGTYTPITAADGGVMLGTPTYWPQAFNSRAWVNNPFNDPGGQVTGSGYLSPATGPGYPIGFDFAFNGDVFDVIGISNGGWISFGKSSDALQAVWVYNMGGTINGDPFIQWYNGPTPTYKRNRVAGFGNSGLQQVDWSSLNPPGQVSKIRVATIGTAPNRTCVVQWEDYGMNNDVTVSMNKVNFQIRLNEVDNSVEVVFGPMDWVSSLGRYQRAQCGLSGRTNADFNGRMTVYEEPAFLYDWNTTVAADTNEAFCQFQAPQFGQPNGSGVPPALGLTWRWDPPVCAPPAWPLTVGNISFDGASATWEATSAGEYAYFLSTENSTTGPEVASGTTTDLEAFFFGLEPNTTYYVFVRSICAGEPGTWSLSTSFETLDGGVVACDGGVVTENYCSQTYDTKEWSYVSADGSPLRLEFQAGFIGTAGSESFEVWEGTGPSGAGTEYLGDLAGNIFESLSGAIYLRLITDAGACEAQPWYLPLEWRVGCKNCTDPLVNFAIGEMDCTNQQYYVDVNVFSMGSATSLSMENSLGLPATVVSTTGIHAVGPFPAGQSVVITAQNPDNLMCYAPSAPMLNEPCAIEDCGPTEYTHCYGDGDVQQWAFQSDNGQEIGIRFLEGTVGLGDDVNLYNSLDIFSVNPTSIGGALANQLFTSAPPSTEHALVMELIADNAVSCLDEDPLFGTSQAWKWVVACYDGCTQPQASFASTCLSQTSFEVAVTVSNIGSTGSVNITNDGGAASVNATATGTYTVGPFQAGTPVTINVEGANVLCTWTSPALNPDCLTTGVDEQAGGQLVLFPNPSNGTFQLMLPAAMNGTTLVQVMDLTGRLVAQEQVNSPGSLLQLAHLPNGFYTVVAQSATERITAKISIQH